MKTRIKTIPLKQSASGRRKSEIFPSSSLSLVPSSPTILITDFSPFSSEATGQEQATIVSTNKFIINMSIDLDSLYQTKQQAGFCLI